MNVFQSQMTKRFFALNISQIEGAIKDVEGGHSNWKTFYSGVSAKDVADSDLKTVGQLLRAIQESYGSEEAK